MLKEFRVANFKSIQKEQVFTMEACPKTVVSEYPEHVIEVGEERLLKVTSIYGPNGGGKSNLLKALSTLAIVINQKALLNDSIKNQNYFPNVYLKAKETSFTMFIVSGGYEIGYSLLLDLNNLKQVMLAVPTQNSWVVDYIIVKEELIFRKLDEQDFETMFVRNADGVISSEILDDIDLIKNNRPLARNATFLKYFNDVFIMDSTNADANPMFIFYQEFNAYAWLRREFRAFSFSKNDVDRLSLCLPKAVEILNSLDMRILNLVFKEEDPGFYQLYVERETKEKETILIPIINESSGTIKAINIIFDVLSAKNNCVFIADDFDAHLHPKLLKAIVELFASASNKTRQLIFNSHDIINMSNKLFRRDEIWFAYRDEDYSTQYVPLSNIVNYKGEMIRKDAVYSKQYLEGRFGADPFIKKGLSWCDE